MTYSIIPRPKHISYKKDFFSLTENLVLFSNLPDIFIPSQILNVVAEQKMMALEKADSFFYIIIAETEEKACTLLSEILSKHTFSKPEEYYLKVDNQGIALLCCDEKGGLNALSSLKSILLQSRNNEVNACDVIDYPDLELRGAMFCWHQNHDFMPYFAPNLECFISKYLDTLFDAKINTFLLEYETFFPWEKNAEVSSKEALSKEEIKTLNQEAKRRGIEIIPLVQTLGHVYHILMHDKHKHLREAPDELQQACPLHEGTTKLALELIDETIALHPESRYIHLGGDECRLLGVCPKCRDFAETHSKYQLYAQYYKKLTDYVIGKGYIPILWHDIAIKESEVLKNFSSKVIFQFWNYGDISHGDMANSLNKLQKFVKPESIIGAPAGRAEKFHGALHPSYEIIFTNVAEMTGRMQHIKSSGSIMCDWPDCGIAFMASFMPYCFHADSCWNQPDIETFQRNYAQWRFGIERPDFFERLRTLYGEIPFARSFSYDLKSTLNRYSLTNYDFEKKAKEMIEDGARGRATGDIYRLFNHRLNCQKLLPYLEECLEESQYNQYEIEHYILVTELEIFFITLSIGTWLALTLDLDFDMDIGYSKNLVYNDVNTSIEQWDNMKTKVSKLYSPLTAKVHLDNYLLRLFKPEIKIGAKQILRNFKF